MFCPECGSPGQTPDSYCRQCGKWIPDMRSGGGRFGRSTRADKIRRMKVLQFVSIGLSLTATLIIVHVVANGVDQEMLPLAALCAFLVAIYQMITVFIGNKVLTPQAENQEQDVVYGQRTNVNELKSADTSQFINPESVVDNTTELLDPIPRSKAPDGDKL